MNTTVRKSEIEVRTSEFEMAHGRKPKGTGFWFFEIAGKLYLHNGKYSDCKKSAIAKAVEVGAYIVKVCS